VGLPDVRDPIASIAALKPTILSELKPATR
jgi:hypothetical protein